MKSQIVNETTVGGTVTDAVKSTDAKQVRVLVKEDRYKPNEGFCILFLKPSIDIAKKITYADFKLLLAYAEVMEFGNQISINQSDMARRIGVSQPSVARSLKRLKEIGVLYSPPDMPNSLFMDPKIIAKGSLDQFRKQFETEEQKQA